MINYGWRGFCAGKLVQIEYALMAVASGAPSVGIKVKNKYICNCLQFRQTLIVHWYGRYYTYLENCTVSYCSINSSLTNDADFRRILAFFIVESISVDDVPVVIKRNTVQFSNCHLYSTGIYLTSTTLSPIFGRNADSVQYLWIRHSFNQLDPPHTEKLPELIKMLLNIEDAISSFFDHWWRLEFIFVILFYNSLL